ncbi:FliH/SctL family protein [Pseudactinotalea terrae]|uniref:FliH/SctL family protein n=1 Tax=Pseudactinotalea terrae TaxID=1743262 RepID=UPI0012E2C0E2|nr:FliH/SctL family protein [Pseudactinotalea terrae]
MSSRAFAPALPVIVTGEAAAAAANATRRGHAAGYAAGLRAASESIAAQLAQHDAEHAQLLERTRAEAARAQAAMAAAARELRAREVGVVADAQDCLLAAAIDLAEAILGVELTDGPLSARAAVTRALSTVGEASVRLIRVNPADLRHLDLDTTAGVQVVADQDVPAGDAVAELDDGYLDAAIGSALHRARAALESGGSR